MDINELRAEVARRQKAAQAKIGRLRRKGVQLEGSEFDVRRDPTRVARYNRSQLNSYLGQLNEFTQRRVQFVPGAEGVPIRAHVFRHAQRTAREFNEFVSRHESGVNDIFIPKQGMTSAEFRRDVEGSRKRGKGGRARPLTAEIRNSFEFVSEDKIKAWRDSMERKMRPNYLEGTLQKQKYQMLQIVDMYGQEDMSDIARSLTDEQINVLWNYTDAPRDAYTGYHMMQLMAAGKADETFANIQEDASSDLREWLQWAQTLPARGGRKR